MRSIRAIDFVSDSEFLVAGLDERVLSYGVEAAIGNDRRVRLLATGWWERARSEGGNILCCDAHPAIEIVAIGGVSARGAGGDIALMDRKTWSISDVLPTDPDDARHSTAVYDLSISPSGKQVASIDYSGEVRIWAKNGDKVWQSRIVSPSDLPLRYDERRKVCFVSEEVLLFSKLNSDGSTGSLVLEKVGNPQQVIKRDLPGGVMAISRAASGQWAAADGGGRIWRGVVDEQTGQNRELPLIKLRGKVATSLSFDSASNLLASTAGRPAAGQGGFASSLELWGTKQVPRQLSGTVISSSGAPVLASAISPDGRNVTTSDPRSNAIRLFAVNLDNRLVETARDPISKSALSCSVIRPRRVVFAKGSQRVIGMSAEESGDYELGFSLDRLNAISPIDDMQWSQSPSIARGWELSFNSAATEFSQRATIRTSGQVVGSISLNSEAIDIVGLMKEKCVNFVSDNLGRPFAVAIGTTRGGILVYGLLAKNGVCPLLRHYRDHSDSIESLAVSSGSELLASASSDGTVKLWSLAGLRPQVERFEKQVAWGAVFLNSEGKVTVSNVQKAGIAAARDLRVGDLISEVYQVGGTQPIRDAEGILAALETHSVLSQLTVTRSRANAADRTLNIVPGWEPMATLFLTSENEWAIWNPQGYFSSSVNGDQLFGWTINQSRTSSPRFIKASQLRDQFEKPEVLKRLFKVGNMEDALTVSKFGRSLLQAARELPEISISSPQQSATLAAADGSFQLKSELKFPASREDYNVQAYLNGSALGDAKVMPAGQPGTFLYSWNAKANLPTNRIRLRIAKKGDLANSDFAEKFITFKSIVPKTKYRVHVMGVAVAAEYEGSEYPRLTFSVKDVESIVNRLNTKQGDFYDLIQPVTMLTEGEVSLNSIEQSVREISRRMASAGPSDMFWLVLSGHGEMQSGKYVFIAPDGTPIPWSSFEPLLRLRCPKVVLIDTCASGAASVKNVMRRAEAMDVAVMAASRGDERAFEDPVRGHGYFTAGWLDALAGEADGYGLAGIPKDREVSLGEAIVFVKNEVPRRRQRQNPVYCPLTLPNFLTQPLVKY